MDDARGGDSTAQDLWLVSILFAALTLVMAWPLVADVSRRVLSANSDSFLFMWTLAWDTHAFTHQPLNIFDANIYYPQHDTLAYSENLIGSAFIAAPVIWLSHNIVLALNLVELSSCALCGVGAYLLARRVGVGKAGAIVSGLVFAFSPPRFLRLDQVFLTTIQWTAFSLAFQHAYWDGGRPRDLRLAAAFFSLQALTSGHGAVYLAVASLMLTTYRLAVLRAPIALGRRANDLGVTGALCLMPCLLVVLPYLAVQSEMGLKRTLDWEIAPSSFFSSPAYVHQVVLSLVGWSRVNQTAEAELFPGYLPFILGALAFLRPGATRARDPRRRFLRGAVLALDAVMFASLIVAVWVTSRGPIRLEVAEIVLFSAIQARRPWMVSAICAIARAALAVARLAPLAALTRLGRSFEALGPERDRRLMHNAFLYGAITLVSLWLAIGPPYGGWRFVYWLPGFNFIRAASRFTLLEVLGLAVLAGIGFERLSAGLGSRPRRVAAVLVSALLVCEFAVPLDTEPFEVDIPAVDRWLDTQPKPFVVAEIPVPHPKNEWRHTAYMLHSTAHWQKTVHGYSGLRPPLHQDLYWQLTRFPDDDGVRTLHELGVTYVVVHADLYPPDEWRKVNTRLDAFRAWLKLERADGAGRVYSIHEPAAQAR